MAASSYLLAPFRGPALGRLLAAALDAWLERSDRRRQLRDLDSLDDRMLKDLGLSRADVERVLTSPYTSYL